MFEAITTKPSAGACRYCSSAIRKVPLPKTAPHPDKPLVLCVRCDRADLWPNVQ